MATSCRQSDSNRKVWGYWFINNKTHNKSIPSFRLRWVSPWPRNYMRKSEKSMLFFSSKKKTIFILRGTLSKPIVFDFLYFFYWRKKFFVHFEEYIFFSRVFFHFFTLFSLRFISTQSDFGAKKTAFKHCTPPIMVSLAYYTTPGPILIPKWDQKTTKEWQDLHIPKYNHWTALGLTAPEEQHKNGAPKNLAG